MKHYDRYVLGQLIQTFGFFCLILILAYWINRSLGIFDNLIGDGQSTSVFFELIFLFLPQVIAIVLPIAALASIILTISKLSSGNELTIFDAAGMKPLGILKPFIYFALIIAVFSAFLSLTLVPISRGQLDLRTKEISKDIISKLISDGSFMHPVPKMTIFVSVVNNKGELEDIFIHDQRSIERDLTYVAKKAVLVKKNEQSHLVLFNGLLQTLDLKSKTLSHVGFDSLTYELSQLSSSNNNKMTNIDNYGIFRLFLADPELLEKLQISKSRAHFEVHDRLLKPFQCILYILLCSVIMSIGSYNRFGLYRQILASVIIILIFNILSTNGLTLVRRDSDNWPYVYLPLLLGFILLKLLFHRMRKPFYFIGNSSRGSIC